MYKWFCTTFIILGACATPPSMRYQRTEFQISKIGELAYSNSSGFSETEVVRSNNQATLSESWVIQNLGLNEKEILLNQAFGEIEDKKISIICSSNEGNDRILLKSKEKTKISCVYNMPNQKLKNDLWVVMKVPTSDGHIYSKKLVRVEDFEE